jgi:predicted N-acetyltransferase YhbS
MENQDINVEYLHDNNVDQRLDKQLRSLLTRSFADVCGSADFSEQRFHQEPYFHRFIIKNKVGDIIAHLGVHEKEVMSEDKYYSVAGIGDVCVHPDYQGRGLLSELFNFLHQWLKNKHFLFTLLFGDARIYTSQGYLNTNNLYCKFESTDWTLLQGMYKTLFNTSWPISDVYLQGKTF